MKTKSILIIPNHEMQYQNHEINLEKAEVTLIERLNTEGYRVGVAAFMVSTKYASLTGKLLTDKTKVHPLGYKRAHSTPTRKFINYVSCAIKAPYLIFKYDSIYAFFPGHTSTIICFWARLLRRPYGLYVRCNWLKEKKTPKAAQFVLEKAKFMIVTGDSFNKMLSCYTNNILTEVPLTPFKPQYCQGNNHQFSRTNYRLLFVGRICESKGILDILHSLPNLINNFPNIMLSIAGGGTKSEEQRIKSTINSLDISAHVELLGHIGKPELEYLYQNSDVMVFPSYFIEGFPRVLYEAMMFNLPIVTCPMPGTEGFLIELTNCLYCQPKNPNDLFEKLTFLLDSPELRKEMGDNNLSLVDNLYRTFNHDSHEDQLIGFLEPRLNSISENKPTHTQKQKLS